MFNMKTHKDWFVPLLDYATVIAVAGVLSLQQDRSSKLMLKTDVKRPTDTTIANMQQTHKAAADVVLNADESLSSVKPRSAGDFEFPCWLDDAASSSSIVHRQGKASRARAKQRFQSSRELKSA